MSGRFRWVLEQSSFRYLVSSATLDSLAGRITHMLLIALIPLASPGRLLTYAQGALVIALPPIVLAPFIGVLVDRWNRRQILAWAGLAQTGLLLLAPLLFWLSGSLGPAWVLLFLYFVFDVFKNTAYPATVPAIIPPEQIVTANAVWSMLTRIGTVLGMIGGGYLVRWCGWQVSFALDALARFAAALLVLGVAVEAGLPSRSGTARLVPELTRGLVGFLRQVAAVITLVGRNRHVAFVMFSILVSFGVTGIAYTVLLFLIQQVLKLGTVGVGIYTAIMALGMLLGALLMGLAGEQIPKARVIVLGCFLVGLFFLAGPWLINIWFIGMVALISGIVFSWIGIAQNSILQTRIAVELQGRLFATREFFSNVAFLGTTAIIGVVSLVAALKTLMIATGLVLLAFATLGLLLARGLDDSPTAA